MKQIEALWKYAKINNIALREDGDKAYNIQKYIDNKVKGYPNTIDDGVYFHEHLGDGEHESTNNMQMEVEREDERDEREAEQSKEKEYVHHYQRSSSPILTEDEQQNKNEKAK